MKKIKGFFQKKIIPEDPTVMIKDGKIIRRGEKNNSKENPKSNPEDFTKRQPKAKTPTLGQPDNPTWRPTVRSVYSKQKPKSDIEPESDIKPEPDKVISDRGRLPKIDRFWQFLKISGRSGRTIAEYKIEYKWWKKEANRIGRSVYLLRFKEIEKIFEDRAVKPTTMRRKLALLKKLGKFYLRENKPKLFQEASKIETPKLPKRLPGDLGPDVFLEYRELAQDWASMNKREGLWVGLMMMCGLRISEIQTVRFKGQKQIKVIGKGNKERILPCPEWLLIALRTTKRSGRGGWVQSRKTIWKKLSDEGIRHPHNLRHTFASECLRRGKTIVEVQKLLGHENIATTNIYTQLEISDDVAEILDQ